MSVNFDLGHSVVDSWDLNVFWDSILNPAFHNGEFAPFFEFVNQLFHRDGWPQNLENLADIALITLQINESTQNDGNSLRILTNFEQIHFNVFGEVVFIEIAGEFIVLLMSIAKENDGLGVSKFQLQQNIFDFYWVIAISFAFNHFFDWSELSTFSSCLNVFMMHVFVIGRVDDSSEEEENSIERTYAFEHFDDVSSSKLLKILNTDINNDLKTLPVESKHLLHAGKCLFSLHFSQKVTDEIRRKGMWVK